MNWVTKIILTSISASYLAWISPEFLEVYSPYKNAPGVGEYVEIKEEIRTLREGRNNYIKLSKDTKIFLESVCGDVPSISEARVDSLEVQLNSLKNENTVKYKQFNDKVKNVRNKVWLSSGLVVLLSSLAEGVFRKKR
jgi:hypothetical protein